jgi:hypothetical protein
MIVDKKKIFIAGLLGLFASIIVGAGEFLLHFSPQIIVNAENYQFFQFVS